MTGGISKIINSIMKSALRKNKILCPTLLFTASYSLFSSDCERDTGEAITATAQRLKAGLRPSKLRISRITVDGIQTYTPIGNFGRFGADGMMVARVASVDIRCNQSELIKLWLDQSRRADWDTSCSAMKIITVSDSDATSDLKSVNTAHFVEKSELGFTVFPLRDYVIKVFQPFPGKWHLLVSYILLYVALMSIIHIGHNNGIVLVYSV